RTTSPYTLTQTPPLEIDRPRGRHRPHLIADADATLSSSSHRGMTNLPPTLSRSTSRGPPPFPLGPAPCREASDGHRSLNEAPAAPHTLACQLPCPADAAPCGSAVLAPSVR